MKSTGTNTYWFGRQEGGSMKMSFTGWSPEDISTTLDRMGDQGWEILRHETDASQPESNKLRGWIEQNRMFVGFMLGIVWANVLELIFGW